MDVSKKISRRSWLKRCAIPAFMGVLSVGGIRFAVADAPKKVSKATAKYQDHPKDGKSCASCKYFIPSSGMGFGMMGGMAHGMMVGTCQVVEGEVSARGYCILYAPE